MQDNPMEIDVYDFDKTVFPMDSTAGFWRFCLLRAPWILVFLPLQLLYGLLYACKLISLTTFKGLFLCFVRVIDVPRMVQRYWNAREELIYPWFQPENRERTAVVVSASPEFLLCEICRRLKVELLIATKADSKTGRIKGKNCKGEEKVARLRALLPNAKVVNVYSDSKTADAPLFQLGEHRILTTDGKREEF